ncbi:hypothetical protein NIB75_19040 [Bacteroides uniformis]|nr:hypothetical protein [Bacteroides uniformis]
MAKITAPEGCTKIGANKEKYFDGVIKRILDNVNSSDAEVVAGGQCIISGTTELTDGAAVEAALYAMWRKCPKQIRKKTSLTFVVGWDAWDAYDQYISDKQVKYSENTEVNRYRFKGKRIVPVVGIPEHTMVLGEFSTGMDSNLWMGVDYANDTDILENRPSAGQLRAVLFPDAHENGREHRPPGGDRGPYRLQEERITHLSSFSISTRGSGGKVPFPIFILLLWQRKSTRRKLRRQTTIIFLHRRLGAVPVPETASENLGTGGETEDRLPAKTSGKGNAGSEETTEPHILSLLKKFPAYPSLYIDTHGGTYAPDTAAAIEGQGRTLQESFLQRT